METILRFQNVYAHPLLAVPFTVGVPLPRGMVRHPEEIGLKDSKGVPVPLAVQPMARWPDGSLRWVLLDFQGDFAPQEKIEWTLSLAEGRSRVLPSEPVSVSRGPEGEVEVSTGALRAVFRPRPFRLIHSLEAEGRTIIGDGMRSDIQLVNTVGKIFRASLDPAPVLSVEEETSLRVVVRWDGGLFAGDGERLTEYRVKFHFFAGNPYVKVEHSMLNRESPEKGIWLRSYTLVLETALSPQTEKVVRQKNHGTDYFSRLVALRANVNLLVPTEGQQRLPAGYTEVYKEHPTGIFGVIGKVILEDESAFQEPYGEYPHFLRPDAPRVRLGGGYSVVFPFLGVRDAERTVVVSILRMGPQHPKAIRADENRMEFDLWPAEAPALRLCRGMTKTHHLAWSFFGTRLSEEAIEQEAMRREHLTEYADPVSFSFDPVYVRRTGVMESDRLLPYLPDRYPRVEAKLAAIRLHGDPLAFSGMLNYGEKEMTNNEEDQGHEYAMEFMRTGRYEWYRKLVAQMLHNSTVDVVCWDPDPLRMGGTPYHTTYHQDAVCVTSHTWTEGMFEYAFLTGDREAYRAAVGICDWILRFMEHKPELVKVDGREIGWPIIALTAGYEATGDERYLRGAFQLVDFYREKVARYGFLANEEPPGAGYFLVGYGEYAGFEGMHKLWRVTQDEALRKFAVDVLEDFVFQRGHILFTGHGRFMDMYAVYAGYEMSKDPRWLELAKKAMPFVLMRKDWNGYFYRRIIHFLNLCHEQGFLDDNLVILNE